MRFVSESSMRPRAIDDRATELIDSQVICMDRQELVTDLSKTAYQLRFCKRPDPQTLQEIDERSRTVFDQLAFGLGLGDVHGHWS